jgi:hypothetical protein
VSRQGGTSHTSAHATSMRRTRSASCSTWASCQSSTRMTLSRSR